MTNTLLHALVCVCVRAREGVARRAHFWGEIRERAKGGLVRESWRTLATRSLIRPLKSDVSIGGMEGWIVGFGEAGGFEIVKSLLAADDGSINPYSDFYDIYIYIYGFLYRYSEL